MKNLLGLLLLIPLLCWSQNAQPTLYKVINIKAISGQEKALESAVKTHNERYHRPGPYQANLIYNINGSNGGSYSWVMGPSTWTALDSEDQGDAHWDKSVSQHVETFSPPEFWNWDEALSNIFINRANSKSVAWMYDLKNGKEGQWAELVGKVKEVFNKKRPDENLFVAWNAFSNAEGRDAVLIFNFSDWATLDDERNFEDDYEAVHGKGSYHNFLNQLSDCINGRIDWLRYIVE